MISNVPATDHLSREEAADVAIARQAMAELGKTIYTWLNVGRGIRTLRRKADRIGGKATFYRLLSENGLSVEPPDAQINPATVSLLLKIMEREGEVVGWHGKLPEKLQREIASPSAIWARCSLLNPKAAAKDPTLPAPMRPPAPRKSLVTSAPKGHADATTPAPDAAASASERAELAKLRKEVHDLRHKFAATKSELEEAKPGVSFAIALPGDATARIKQLEADVALAQQAEQAALDRLNDAEVLVEALGPALKDYPVPALIDHLRYIVTAAGEGRDRKRKAQLEDLEEKLKAWQATAAKKSAPEGILSAVRFGGPSPKGSFEEKWTEKAMARQAQKERLEGKTTAKGGSKPKWSPR